MTAPAAYLSATEAASRIGMNLTTFNMHRHRPPPDVITGATTQRPVKGWLPATIDAWNDERTAIAV